MPRQNEGGLKDAPLNPSLKREVDGGFDNRFEGTDPMSTLSVQDPEEGRSWPMIWAVVAIGCALLAAWYLLT